MTALTGDLSLTLPDGTTLTGSTDLGLARQWAEHEHGAAAWAALTWTARNVETAAALAAVRAAAGEG
ncbi:hypothetical protein ET495_17350 (plasmid) [Xylanimonas allomyrinae]|uniref:Uncharacterized protein n=1 Tax=Xylanimonas allomyrinae TaxID=2509459 RepID=A0A4P6EWN1_9MICO|nr:hypothetical protein [Xylanimonas allomyrinae]QAY64987.1 hypothetical protein ET495_17350 [Xylanimonas allomyrinae]